MHACALNSANVDENILAAIFWLNEAKAFLVIKPLYDTLIHRVSFRRRVNMRIGNERVSAVGSPVSRFWRKF